MKQYELINLKAYEDARGNLIAFEQGANCPFDVKRCFYIYDTKMADTVRGAHANRRSEFLLVVIHGSCKVRIDTGKEKDEVLLNSPKTALYLDKMVWKEMFDFSDGAVLMVLSNEKYDEKEYIRDYEKFLKEINN
ncbi:FdtA/QdtA family cupin domain-containing protein [bacterium]|nr:FdtA/QdtA family cupin domain-containing protein [bacterium]